MQDLDGLYRDRFSDPEAGRKREMWRPVVRYLERWISPDAAVLDVACDRGYFINNCRARERWAIDVRDIATALAPDITFVVGDGLTVSRQVPRDYFDVVFMSNYLEHLASVDDVVRQLTEVARVLKPGGRAIVLQPNVRLVGTAYWDFLDHRVPLTDRSLAEATRLAGLDVEHAVTRFLPYSTKGALPQHPLLVRAYLAFPPAWRLMGKQSLLIAMRPRRE